MANCQQLDIEIAQYDAEIMRMQSERETLVAKRLELVAVELADAVAKVIGLGGTASAEKPQEKTTMRTAFNGPKKYLDPETGVEWSGQGNSPDWIKEKVKENFLNPAWSAANAAKKVKTKVSSYSATATPTLGAEAGDQDLTLVANVGGQVPTHQQDGPTDAELKHPASIALADSNAKSVAELHAVPTLTVAPTVATTTSSPRVPHHDLAPQPVNPVANPVVAQAI